MFAVTNQLKKNPPTLKLGNYQRVESDDTVSLLWFEDIASWLPNILLTKDICSFYRGVKSVLPPQGGCTDIWGHDLQFACPPTPPFGRSGLRTLQRHFCMQTCLLLLLMERANSCIIVCWRPHATLSSLISGMLLWKCEENSIDLVGYLRLCSGPAGTTEEWKEDYDLGIVFSQVTSIFLPLKGNLRQI